jgi:hypothetical protein
MLLGVETYAAGIETDATGAETDVGKDSAVCSDNCCWWVNTVDAAGYTDSYCCVQKKMLQDVERDAARCRDRCCSM